MLSVNIVRVHKCNYAECHYTVNYYTEFYQAECQYTLFYYAQCNYADFYYTECHYAECQCDACCYTECHYTECRGALYYVDIRCQDRLPLEWTSTLGYAAALPANIRQGFNRLKV